MRVQLDHEAASLFDNRVLSSLPVASWQEVFMARLLGLHSVLLRFSRYCPSTASVQTAFKIYDLLLACRHQTWTRAPPAQKVHVCNQSVWGQLSELRHAT